MLRKLETYLATLDLSKQEPEDSKAKLLGDSWSEMTLFEVEAKFNSAHQIYAETLKV